VIVTVIPFPQRRPKPKPPPETNAKELFSFRRIWLPSIIAATVIVAVQMIVQLLMHLLRG
jgi:hypothetical protein